MGYFLAAETQIESSVNVNAPETWYQQARELEASSTVMLRLLRKFTASCKKRNGCRISDCLVSESRLRDSEICA